MDGTHIELPSRDYRLPVRNRPFQRLGPVACGAENGMPVGIGRRVLHEGDDGRAQGVFLLAPVPAVLCRHSTCFISRSIALCAAGMVVWQLKLKVMKLVGPMLMTQRSQARRCCSMLQVILS